MRWLVSNKLWIDVSKTVIMLIGLHQKVGSQCLAIAINNKPLCSVSIAKYLGVYIDQCLTWRTHVDSILSKARFKMCCIKCLQWTSIYLFSLLYQVFIIPLFDYCDVVWSPMMNQLRIMERLHSKVTSRVYHIRERLSSCFHYSLLERRRFHSLVQIYKILHQVSPPYSFNLFCYAKDATGH